MKIGGLQKTSLQDYPDTLSAIVWTVGCNFCCPFCYNTDLVFEKSNIIPEKEIFDFLKKRKGLLEGLVISGGEPLMQKDIFNFCEKVKKIGYQIKIDTNGSYPEKLKQLIDKKLVDYIAMDIKAPKEKYNQLTGVKTDIKKIEKSIDLIKESKAGYEFKTTFVPNLLKIEDIAEIGNWLKGSKKFFLQQYKNDTPVISNKLETKMPYSKDQLEKALETVKTNFEICKIRGI